MKPEPWRALLELHWRHGSGVIDGVRFDFSHPELSDDWRPVMPLADSSSFLSGVIFEPGRYLRLVYPWTCFQDCPAILERSRLRGWRLLRHIAVYGPYGWIGVGDLLFVRSVARTNVTDSDFQAPQDRSGLRVRYAIQRVNGAIERVHGSLFYLHRDRDWGERITWIAGTGFQEGLCASAVERRLRAVASPGDFDNDEPTEECDTNVALCWEALRYAEQPSRSAFQKDARDSALIKAGYFLAKAEHNASMLPYAKAGAKAKRAQAVATAAKSAQADPVRNAALADIAAHPHTTRNACANRVAASLEMDARSLSRTIAPLFEMRDLAGGRSETRPRRELLDGRGSSSPTGLSVGPPG